MITTRSNACGVHDVMVPVDTVRELNVPELIEATTVGWAIYACTAAATTSKMLSGPL